MDDLPPTLVALFESEHRQDWGRLRSLLHPDVVWTVIDGAESRTVGADAYVSRLRAAYEEGGASGFIVSRVRRGSGGPVATELVDERGDVSVDIFEVDEGGLVIREWEDLLRRPRRD